MRHTVVQPHQSLLAWTRFIILVLVGVVSATLAQPALALFSIDFEQPYYVHEEWQVWDFCLVFHDGLYNIFYHAIPMDFPTPAYADDIWRATSPDLVHWSPPTPVLSVSFDQYESVAVWAPDVVFDEETGLWWMAYTGVDGLHNQRICMAWSSDLTTWTKSPRNPVFEPSPPVFFFYPDNGWGECRDPFLFYDDGLWHITTTAKTTDLEGGQGALAHATSSDFEMWSVPDVFLLNDGDTPGNSLESSQYVDHADGYHVFFHEYSVEGIGHISATEPGSWTFASKTIIDYGIAPEVDTFDDGSSWLFSRVAAYQEPLETAVSYVIRVDTLQFRQGAVAPTVFRGDPLAADFSEYGGNSCLGNPCFGDNPARRGEDPAAPIGEFYFGSREYFRGPLSNRGAAGIQIGETATGFLNSHRFVVEGNSIRLYVGGSDDPEGCFVALMDADADTVLRHATPNGLETMTLHVWDVVELQGRDVYVRIEDSSYSGHINVDEIHESMEVITNSPAPANIPQRLVDRGPSPNPFNPRTTLRFDLDRPVDFEASVFDLRGRRIWSSGLLSGTSGTNRVTWAGVDAQGHRAAGGVYVYRIVTVDRSAVAGKITLTP